MMKLSATHASFLALSLAVLTLPSIAVADCAVTGATGGGGQVVICTGTDTDGYAGTANSDNITIDGANVSNVDHVIRGSGGDDVITLNSGTITSSLGSGDDGLKGDDGNDTISVNGGSINVDGDGIDGDSGNDVIVVTGGSINSTGDDGIDAGSGNDIIRIAGASVTSVDPQNVNGGSGNDTITLGTGAIVNNTIDCGGDSDTLEFAIEVASADLAAAQAAIAAANPAGDSISISGESYTWLDCEVLQDSLVVAPAPAPAAPPAAQSTGATAVPVMPLWLLGLTAVVVAGIASIHIRRKS